MSELKKYKKGKTNNLIIDDEPSFINPSFINPTLDERME